VKAVRSAGPERLIGRRFAGTDLAAFLSDPDEAPELDEFAGMQLRLHRRSGIDIYVSGRGRIITVFLYGKRFERHRKYRKALPAGLPSFGCSKPEVMKRLGRPTHRGKKPDGRPSWIRYDLADYVIHLEFPEDGSRIERITLMTHAVGNGDID
jgi:hypothetical protein